MSLPAPQSHYEAAGDDLLLTLTATDVDGNVVNITGFTIRAAVARRIGDTPVLSTEASPATITAAITDGANGVFTLAAADVDTDDLLGTYVYQCKLVDGSSDEKVVNHGYITFAAKMLT